ncbi:MAG: hypothetical protein KJN92_07740, partial [Gemmatimonadetes bacterium]|nr:hypothetical protein [Gemmatimonadota bacterium]
GLGMARAGAKIEEGVDHLAAKARDWFETVSVYQSDGGEDKEEFLQLSDEEPQFIVLLSLADKPLWPTAFGGYSLLPRGGA